MKKKILNIEGMTCSACSNGLEKYLNKQDGIELATVNLVMAQAKIEYDEKKLRASDLDRFVKEAGFKSLGDEISQVSRKNSFRSLIVFAILSVVLMYTSMSNMMKLPVPVFLNKMIYPKFYSFFQMIVTILFIIWGFDIIKNGLKNIFHKMPNMDSLVGVGIIINFLYSFYNTMSIYKGSYGLVNKLYFESSAMIILFIKIGRYIDKTNKAKAVDSIKNLVMITPKTGIVFREGKEVIVTINDIKRGDIIISKPGERICVDGTILKGETHTDESFITGEANPVHKKLGDKVLAGSINYDGYIQYVAENIGKDTQVSHIVDLVVEATNTKAPIQKIADKISYYFVPIIFLLSIIAFLLNFITLEREIGESINALVTVLVVACPCSFGLATPLAMIVAIGNASKNGILIKSSECLENINSIDTVVFDKTGTLTKGELKIEDCKFVGNKDEYFNILQSLESKSNHPLAKAICRSKIDLFELIEIDDFEEISGQGVSGKIQGITYFAGNKKLFETRKISNPFEDVEEEYARKGESIVYFGSELGVFGIIGLRDTIKPTVKVAISELKGLSKKIVMLSGDNEKAAKIVADEIGIEEVYGNYSPKEKLDKIKNLNLKQNVMMIGDGINDSPSLKSSAIGISVSNGTDVSSDSSDILLLYDDMKKIYYLFKLGDRTIKIVKQNLFWALFYNVLMIPLAMGLLPFKINPMIASLAMTFSSLTVVVNSLRLKKFLL